ncbi:MAG: aspartyl-phosphate phosphatase Spo0E family protein [Clostridiaceae bacterium]|nr:aspartyl-phosphate phosphatase Spo0E family protein [Clostridiaceae bacterium]
MLNDEICKLREKLNESIIKGQDYMITYKLSIELDELIAEYYRKNGKSKKTKEKSYALAK